MATTNPVLTRPAAQTAARRQNRWTLPQYLALIAVPVIVWETWTIVAWLADGPSPITQFRESGTASWYAARVYEGIAILMAVLVLVYVIKGCRRERRILTFDAMLCITGATMLWSDIGLNFYMPTLLVSSNWVNLSNMCGHMPFVVNPDCGRVPDAVLFFWPVVTFGPLATALLVGALVRKVRSRWPDISTAKLFGIIGGCGALIALAFEVPAIMLDLWSYTASPTSFPLGDGLHYAFPAILETTLFFVLLGMIRVFRDDKGRTFVERNLEHLAPRRRVLVTFLALYTCVQFITWIPGSVPMILNAPYQQEWRKMPRHVVNDICDAPGTTGTRYGPCPGSPEYRIPGRHSLPGHSP